MTKHGHKLTHGNEILMQRHYSVTHEKQIIKLKKKRKDHSIVIMREGDYYVMIKTK